MPSFLIEAIKSSRLVIFLAIVGCLGIVSCSTGRFRYSSHSSYTAAFPLTVYRMLTPTGSLKPPKALMMRRNPTRTTLLRPSRLMRLPPCRQRMGHTSHHLLIQAPATRADRAVPADRPSPTVPERLPKPPPPYYRGPTSYKSYWGRSGDA